MAIVLFFKVNATIEKNLKSATIIFLGYRKKMMRKSR